MRGKIGFLISHSDNYYGVENELDKIALHDLSLFADKLECDVVSYGPIKTGDEAILAKEHFANEEIDYLIFYIADFSVGDIILPFEEVSYPVGIWFPKEPYKEGDIQLNSAVSANMFASIVQRRFEKPYKCDWYYGTINDELVSKRLELNLRVVKAKKNIEVANIGILGEVAPTFYNLENNKIQTYFPQMNIVKFDIEYLMKLVDQVTDEEIQEAKQMIINSCQSIEAEEKSVMNSAKAYVALKKYILEHKIDCLAAACWPDFQEALQIVPCVIYTLLGSELNVPVACEGDIGGAITLLMAKELSGRKPTLMDLTSIDEETGDLLLWHCGIGSVDLQPETDVKIINHPMLDRKNPDRELMGLAYDYHFRPGDVTVMRYSNNNKLFSFECSVTDGTHGYSGTRGYLNQFHSQNENYVVKDVVDTLFKNGIEHHLIVCPGNIEAGLNKLAELLNIAEVSIERYKL